ncbi:MAG: recombinase family protein [Eubacterium sp.]|nr:recombinase family protein [Eubacterium sp.]
MKKKDHAKQDDRAVVIYARKSKITHKGDSIANQEEYCKEYARLHLQLPADYEFRIYEDEGKSGFYADRPDFQRMIRDVEQNRIRAIVCYKLDRISRKMSDLTAMIDYLNKHGVALLISSNNLNTQDSNSKMMIQMLGIIAEFERDIIKERITDNLIELAKDGRWMGGIPPTGFTVDRSKYGSGNRKNGYAYLITIPEEKKLIQRVFRVFLETRSYNAAANRLNEEGLKTKTGMDFSMRAVRDIVTNPVYCRADQEAYRYFVENEGNVYGEEVDFNGNHGISVYNRTRQMREESDDSTFLRPEFSRTIREKDIDEWIIAIGRHEGFIDGKDWVQAQSLKEDIADRYNRPHRATNALLAGLMYCPKCHRRLNVIPESNRFTHGKPRFKYACPNAVRKGPCNYQAVHGVEMDEYIVEKLSSLSDEEQNYYLQNIQRQIDQAVKSDKTQQDILTLQKEIDRLDRDTRAQVKALRSATEATWSYLEADINEMAEEIAEKRKLLSSLERDLEDQQSHLRNYEEIRNTLLSFSELVKDAEPAEIINLISTVIERVYVTRDGKEEICHIYIKGCVGEDYSDEEDYFFGCSGTLKNESDGEFTGISEGTEEMCDSEECRKLYSYLCRDTAACGVQQEDAAEADSVREKL